MTNTPHSNILKLAKLANLAGYLTHRSDDGFDEKWIWIDPKLSRRWGVMPGSKEPFTNANVGLVLQWLARAGYHVEVEQSKMVDMNFVVGIRSTSIGRHQMQDSYGTTLPEALYAAVCALELEEAE